MERRFTNYMDFYNAAFNKDTNDSHHNAHSVRVPACINTEYCVASPKNRNDGILTMAFVDMQPLESIFSMNDAFKKGTLFPDLCKPFFGGMQ